MEAMFFPPEGFSAPYSALEIAHLRDAWISKRLNGTWWRDGTPARHRRGDYERLQKALVAAEETLLRHLRDGVLVAHVYSEATGFHQIPATYWNEDASAVSLQGTMFDLEEGQTFAKELHGKKVIVRDDRAKQWLRQEGTEDIDAFYPAPLRSEMASGPAVTPRRTRYNWSQFHAEALRQLDENGTFSGDWIQARLEEHMLQWCAGTWGCEPSRRLVRDHVRQCLLLFLQRRRAI